MSDSMEVVQQWWLEVDPKKRLEQPLAKVAELLVSKGITTDMDSAKKIISKLLGIPHLKNDRHITIDDFNKIFCKCIFKECLIQMFDAIESIYSAASDPLQGENGSLISNEIPLTLKLGAY